MRMAPSDGSSATAAFSDLLRRKRMIARAVHDAIDAAGASLSQRFEGEQYDQIVEFLRTARAVRLPFAGMPLVTPGNPAQSALFLQISDPAGVMLGRFSPEEIQIVERWIRSLAAAAFSAPLTSRIIASGLDQPLFVTAPPGDVERVFIVEKTGAIKIYSLAHQAVLPEPFLRVDDLSTGGERGLLGLAFHPRFGENGRFFVNCTGGDGNTTVRQYEVSPRNSNTAAADSRRDLLHVAQPFTNHNGGWLGFGPDGMLYVALGDGGSGNDPQNNAQNLATLLGKLLRIDVEGDDFPDDSRRNYGIPPDNPLLGQVGARPEIWAHGLRNPWRCSFDRASGDLWIADVGQSAREEINFQSAMSRGGENYGWRIREGSLPTGLGTGSGNFVDPIFEYGRADGSSIIGGYVYRGTEIADLVGAYFYGDFVSGRVWSFRYNGTSIQDHVERTAQLTTGGQRLGSISSFGEDASGNLYLTTLEGDVLRIGS